jgi:hypothetical protein
MTLGAGSKALRNSIMKTSCSLGIVALLIALSCCGCGSSTPPSLTGNWLLTAKVPNPRVLDANGNPTYTTADSWAYLSQEGTSVSGTVVSNFFCAPEVPATFSFAGQFQNNRLSIFPLSAFLNLAGSFTLQATVSSDLATIQSGTISGAWECNPYALLAVTGQQVPSVAGRWAGTLTSVSGPSATIFATLYESGPDSTGFPGIAGDMIFSNSPCFSSGTVAGNQIGTFLSAIVKTTNGTLEIPQFENSSTIQVAGDQLFVSYSVQGGTCNGDYAQGTLTRQ